MNLAKGVVAVTTAELAVRLNTLRGTSAYAVYLAPDEDVVSVLSELNEEFRSIDDDLETDRLSSLDGEQMITDLSTRRAEVVLIDAHPFIAEDWALLDRRRSSLARSGLLVFVTTPSSFEALMRSAPNLASWLGAQVFAYVPDGAEAAARARRLEALRAWASRSDLDVIRAAEEGTLSREPEYAEWLVLLGRSDLLGPRDP